MIVPILWRYLWRSYFQTFFLCVGSFVGILIVLRLQEIARFATSGAGSSTTLYFTLLQIPYILPIAVPISCLIATLLLFQRLSSTHELTALRACGWGLRAITQPLLYAGTLLSLCNFALASELAPLCKSLSKQLVFDIVSSNPLFLLQRDSLVKLKNAYYNIGTLKDNTHAEDVFFAINNTSTSRLSLVCAKQLHIDQDLLVGTHVTLISNVDPKRTSSGFDHLIIENQTEMQTRSAELSQFLQTVDWTTNSEYLSLSGIRAHAIAKRGITKGGQIELAKRLSLGLSPFTFTVLGLGFGIQIGRISSRGKLLAAVLLAALFLSCFIAAKSFHTSALVASLVFLLPHPLLLFLSYRALKRTQRGIE